MIVTIPHGKCLSHYNRDYHMCDSVSRECGERICNLLKQNGEMVLKFIPDVTREKVDMNRDVSLNSDFRGRIREAIKSSKFLWDIHSFPRMKNPPFLNDVYILDRDDPPTRYSVELKNSFLSHGFICDVYRGINNSITDEARDNGLMSLLLEICEDIDIEKRMRICEVFVDWCLSESKKEK
jgi:hypothetical protein